MSDQRIVKALRERSIIIARRTVAKYREELGICGNALIFGFFPRT